MEQVSRYGRWQGIFPEEEGVDRVKFLAPDGSLVTRPTFAHQPAELVYDHHGYEETRRVGERVTAVRFTPITEGVHQYRAFSQDRPVEEGTFVCVASAHPGYVVISERDPRYFALSEGAAYTAIGLDVCWPMRYALPRGGEFQQSHRLGSLGMGDYRRWFSKLAEHGGNFARIWLSNGYFAVEYEVAGRLDLLPFARIDALVDLAQQHDIRLKLCLENFRSFDPNASQSRTLQDEEGNSPRDMADWFTNPHWQEPWWQKVEAYVARYGDDPTIMAWELWNEINACRCEWPILRDWTQNTLERLRPLVPYQLVVNSLGSFDTDSKQRAHDDFRMDAMDFQQVHRYLDQGAGLEVVRTDPVAFSIEAVERSRRPDRPVLLAETGAVNDNHTGPFRYYRHDDEGILFADTTFPAFFAGAAGSGHIWHWDHYVDQKNLWDGYEPLAQMVDGIQLDTEGFQPIDLSNERLWCLGLIGSEHLLLWVRNRADNWQSVLRDDQPAGTLVGEEISLQTQSIQDAVMELCRGWREDVGSAECSEGVLKLPDFRRMLFVRLRRVDGNSKGYG